MKKIFIYGALAAIGASFTSCDDFLNDNRYPLSQQVATEAFWNNGENVANQLNYFYEVFTGYGNGTGYGNFYFNTNSDDQAGTVGGEFRDWAYVTVPASNTAWSTPYEYIRRANNVIVNLESESNTIDTDEKANYLGIARMMRAYEYYLLVRAFGDVPYVATPLSTSDEAELYGPRTARNTVMDNGLADLDFAIANIATESSKTMFSKDLARAMKTEICLFEASYSKYVAKDGTRATKYFNEVVSAAQPLLTKYAPGDDYASLYNSLNGALGDNSEVIFYKKYLQGIFMHSTVDYTSGSTPIAGITKDAFDSFLLTDGTVAPEGADKGVAEPYQVKEKDENGNEVTKTKYRLNIQNLLDARDKRLEATTYNYVFFQDMPWAGPNTANMTSTTGYGVKKYNNFAISKTDATQANKNYTDAPLYWGATICLAYAEAKAELGELDDPDLELTLAPLFKRAGITAKPTLAYLNGVNDTRNNMGVDGLIWEIRRCRRCEFMMDNDIRYWDLVRWNQLELMDTQKHPNIALGANVSMLPADQVNFSTTNGYLNPVATLFSGKNRTYNSKYNLYPIPSGQIALNSKLTQNPGWN